MKEKYNLKEMLKEKDKQYSGDHSIEGKGILTFPQYINSMRSLMFGSHLNQFKNQKYPDFPQFFTGAENLVGKYSDGYKKLNAGKVFRKVVKFEGLVENPTIYKLFIYNNVKKRYEVVDRKPVEDLIEVFGYEYNTSVIDSFNEGDEISEGTIAYRSMSYDENMNYSYGRDIVTMYSLDPFTSEDAAIASDELLDLIKPIESDKNIATLNENDFPLNLYGDENNFKVFPDINEYSNGILMATRRKFNNQVLFDFKADMLNHATDTDTKYYLTGKVIDIDIYCNNEDLQDNSFYHQIFTYWCYQNAYYREIKKTCEEIFDSGEDYSDDIDYLYDRACEMLDLKKKWKEKDNAFSNLQIHILVERESTITVGQKCSGRFGNKCVISDIRKKEDMPFYYDENGEKVYVQLILNLLAIVNRTTAAVIMELATNFIGKRISQYMRSLSTMKEKEDVLWDVLNIFNPKQCEYFKGIYYDLSDAKKKEFINYCETVKIHFNQPSMNEDTPIFYRLQTLKAKYSDILQPDKMYIHKFGRDIPCVRDSYVANVYTIMLKQTPKKGFSVRGIGAISSKGVPERSYKSKQHKDLYSSTAIRFGEFETLNFSIAMDTEEVALIHALYRSSVKGRRDLGKALLSNEPVITVDKTYDSRVAEFFEIILKSLGFKIEFLDSDDDLVELDRDGLEWFALENGKSVLCSQFDKFMLDRRTEIAKEILHEYGVLNTEELNEMIDEEIEDRNYLIGDWDRSKDFFINCVDLGIPTVKEPVAMEEIEKQIEENLMDVDIDLS